MDHLATSDAQDESTPFVLVETGRHGIVVAASNTAATRLAVYSGMSLNDARAHVPLLRSEPIDREADRQALRMLADWMLRFSPRVAIDGKDALVLDVTGCAHLFGGERQMAEHIIDLLGLNGLAAHLSITGTWGSAYACARYAARAGEALILPDGDESKGVSGLPVISLRLSADAVQLLRRFGFTRVGQLYGLDRASLRRRFVSREVADAVVLRLDQLLGLRPEPLVPLSPPPDWSTRLACPEPVSTVEGIGFALQKLAQDVCAMLDAHSFGARDFVLWAFRADGGSSQVKVSTARPVRDVEHICRLFADRLEQVKAGFGIDLFLLTAKRAEALGHDETPLSADMAANYEEGDHLYRLSDRITARLGDGAVEFFASVESHVPERAECRRVFEGEWNSLFTNEQVGPRPIRRFKPPERIEVVAEVPDGPPARFVWRRVLRKAIRADGPERVAPEWWKLSEKGARARDYYRVEDEAGRRYWIYRDGLYDDERGGPPQWYLHGLFA